MKAYDERIEREQKEREEQELLRDNAQEGDL